MALGRVLSKVTWDRADVVEMVICFLIGSIVGGKNIRGGDGTGKRASGDWARPEAGT